MKSTKPNPQKEMIIRLNSQLTEMKRDRDRLQNELDTLKKDLAQSQLTVKSLGKVYRVEDGTWQLSEDAQKKLNILFPNGIKS